jgi:TnpA family transposase
MEEEDRLPSTLDAETIRKQFHLQDGDLREIRRCRGAANWISFAIQLCVLRWWGHFLRDVRTVHWEIWEHISQQLGILAFPLTDFVDEDETRQDHMERIRRYLGITRCGATERQLLLEHLVTEGQITPRSSALQESALRWLAEGKIVRPGRSTFLDVFQTAREHINPFGKYHFDLTRVQRA